MGYRAEVRYPPASKGEAADPVSLVVRHHRVDRAELTAEVLSGGHLFHLALAGCVFNNIHRLAGDRGIEIADARVIADGGFDDDGSTGVLCEIELESHADPGVLRQLAIDAYNDSSIGAIMRKITRVELTEIRITEGTASSPPRS